MMAYRDRWFCPFHEECEHGQTCDRALTDEVRAKAERWWGDDDPPIAMVLERPECFEGIQTDLEEYLKEKS